MTDATLKRVWDSREAISRRCSFDPHLLVKFYQTRQKTTDKSVRSPAAGRVREDQSHDGWEERREKTD